MTKKALKQKKELQEPRIDHMVLLKTLSFFLSLLFACFCYALHVNLIILLHTLPMSPQQPQLSNPGKTSRFCCICLAPWASCPKDGMPSLSVSTALWPEQQDLLTEGGWESLLAGNKTWLPHNCKYPLISCGSHILGN